MACAVMAALIMYRSAYGIKIMAARRRQYQKRNGIKACISKHQ